ncbi:hypothetical protein JAAARDRAFT_195728 [Jaapia argillacea MUCL 33604]|uniref:Uncharacterized protein n=1 Tax=Jaapia argillacea MUCL 33604 TaxID=933084 RepID=A0A067PK93_9AGAM|nr:hypothetical protein JAAARDRAFT_195728 [Jaapia argillacea MUCL 33604]
MENQSPRVPFTSGPISQAKKLPAVGASSQEAAAKQAKKDVDDAEKAAETAEKQMRELKGAERLRALETEQALEDAAEEEYFVMGVPITEPEQPEENTCGGEPLRGRVKGVGKNKATVAEQPEAHDADITVQGKGKKPTATEKKKVHAQDLRTLISPATQPKTPAATSTNGTTAKKTNPATGGFVAGWQEKMAQREALTSRSSKPPARSRRTHLKTPLVAPGPLPRNNNSRNGPANSLGLHPASSSTDDLGGFVDDDVEMKRVTTNRVRGGRQSFDALPNSIKPFWSKIITTILRILRTRFNPWNLDGDGDDFLNLLMRVVDYVCPQEQIDIEVGSPTFTYAKQRVYDWRADFQKRGIRVVKNAILREVGKDAFNGTKQAIVIQWVVKVSGKNGAAFWGKPDSKNPSEAFQSPYILETFSTHLKSMTRSVMKEMQEVENMGEGDVDYEEENGGLPAGALTLATIAVQCTFQMYSSGKYITPDDNFSEKTFESLINKATEYITYVKKGVESKLDILVLMDPSSPPPMDD